MRTNIQWYNTSHPSILHSTIKSLNPVNKDLQEELKLIAPAIIQVRPAPTGEYSIICYFADEKVTRYCMKDNLYGVFEPLRNKDVFAKALTILDGTAAWDLSGRRDEGDCLTIDPWTCISQRM